MTSSPSGSTRNTEIESLPTLVAYRHRAVPCRLFGEDSPLRLAMIRPLAESSTVPLPVPPVSNVPSGSRRPSAPRLQATTSLPSTSLDIPNTAPGVKSGPASCAAANPAPPRSYSRTARLPPRLYPRRSNQTPLGSPNASAVRVCWATLSWMPRSPDVQRCCAHKFKKTAPGQIRAPRLVGCTVA